MPFRTKICGVTTVADAQIVVASGADAMGLNFFSGSKRFVAPSLAPLVAEQLPPHVKRVGVFVNEKAETIREIAAECELDLIQLHGDEPPEVLTELADLSVVRAFRIQAGLGPVREYLASCDPLPLAVLVDAFDRDLFGGTGRTLAWSQLANASKFLGELPLILAGGLTPQNVAEAIRQARPAGVDTASGVEKTQPGQKDMRLCCQFVAAAKAAFDD